MRLSSAHVSALLVATALGLAPALAQSPAADAPPPAATPPAPPAQPPAPATAAAPAAAPAPASAPAASSAPLPPGSPLIGRPDNAAAAKLAPIVPPAAPTAADKIALDKLKVPQGFKLELYASGVADARSMRLGDKGTLFVATRLAGNVHAIVDKDGKREVKTIAKGLHRPSGLAFKDGALYVAELSKVWKYADIEAHLDDPPAPQLVSDAFPGDETHGSKFMGIGPDNKLYVTVGLPCNNCLPSDQHAQLRRMDLDGTNMEAVARGIRNSVGLDWHPVSKQLYFTDNGRDWVSEDLPNDELNRITSPNQHFGAPFCHQGDFLDPEFGWGRSCSEFEKPVALLGPHAGVLGMRFYTGKSFPRQYHNAIFIARHGSWNRTQKIGGDVVVATLNRDGSVRSIAPFLTGFIQDNSYIGRPVDVLVAKDGALLVSDDYAGAIYRIAYGSTRAAKPKKRP